MDLKILDFDVSTCRQDLDGLLKHICLNRSRWPIKTHMGLKNCLWQIADLHLSATVAIHTFEDLYGN